MKKNTDLKLKKKYADGNDYKKRKRHLIVPEIFSAVADAWYKKGMKATISMEDIAAEMGGSTGILYYYFKSKGDMMYQMQQYLFEKMAEELTPIYEDRSLTARQRLEKVLASHIMVNCRYWKIARALWTDYAWDIQPADLVLINKIKRKEYMNSIQSIFDEICAAEGRDASDNKLKVMLSMNMIDQIWGWYVEGKGYSADELARLTVGYIINGFLPLQYP